MLLQVRFGMPIRFVERINGIFEVMKLTELMGHLGEDKSDRAADRFLPIGDHAFDRHLELVQLFFDEGSQRGQITLRVTSQRTRQQDLLREAITHHPEHLMPHIGLQPIDGQDHLPLLLQSRLDALVIRHAQRHPFFIALHQIGHTPLRDAHPTAQQSAIHLWHAAVFTKTKAPNQGNHLQAKFPVWERSSPFFFGPVGDMIARTLRLDTATDYHRQLPEAIQLGHRAMAVIAYP